MSRFYSLARSYNNQKTSTNIACISVIVLHLILSCHATVFHLPLKQYRNVVPTTLSAAHNEDNNIIHVHKRETPFENKTLSKSMRNNLHGLSGEGYYIDINIGTPPQKLQVLIDTGSANFAIACGPVENLSIYFVRQDSSTYEEDGTEIYVPYTEGEWTGKLGTDIVSPTSASTLSAEAKISCITSSSNFFEQGTDWEGILGLAYADLARPDSSITPFWDSLLEAHSDLENVFSMQLCGSSFIHTRDKPLMKGSLILGGVLPSLALSEFFYTPVYKEWYYEVIITDIQVTGKSLRVDCKEYNLDKTIVDSGTTTIRLPIKVFQALTDYIDSEFLKWDNIPSPGLLFYSGEDTLCYDDMTQPFSAFPIVSFFLMETANTSFRLDLTPQHYLRPVTRESEAGGVVQSCVKFGFSSSATGTVLGAVLMEAFYVVFDRANARIGFAQTSCPLPDPSKKILNKTVQGIYTSNSDLNKCAFKKPDSGERTFVLSSYILLAVSLLVCIPLIMLCGFQVKKTLDRRWNRNIDDDFSESRTFSAAMID